MQAWAVRFPPVRFARICLAGACTVTGLGVIYALGGATAQAQSSTRAPQPIILTLPKLAWAIEIRTRDLVVFRDETSPDGRQRRLAGRGRADPFELLSGSLEWARPEATSHYCREFY